MCIITSGNGCKVDSLNPCCFVFCCHSGAEIKLLNVMRSDKQKPFSCSKWAWSALQTDAHVLRRIDPRELWMMTMRKCHGRRPACTKQLWTVVMSYKLWLILWLRRPHTINVSMFRNLIYRKLISVVLKLIVPASCIISNAFWPRVDVFLLCCWHKLS